MHTVGLSRTHALLEIKQAFYHVLFRFTLRGPRHIARVSRRHAGIGAKEPQRAFGALHRGWDCFKCLNYLTKSTRKYVATSSKGCGTSIRSISSPARC